MVVVNKEVGMVPGAASNLTRAANRANTALALQHQVVVSLTQSVVPLPVAATLPGIDLRLLCGIGPVPGIPGKALLPIALTAAVNPAVAIALVFDPSLLDPMLLADRDK